MLTERLQKSYPSLTKQQKKVAELFLTQDPEAVFLSVAELARQSKTSQSTVVRFSRAIGFRGYPDLQRELQNWLKQKISPSKVLQNFISKEPEGDTYSNIFQIDYQNLTDTQEANRKGTLDRVVKGILEAKRIGFVGFRTSHAVANLLYFFIARVRSNCELLDAADNLTHQLMNYGRRDLLFGISFPRYSRRTSEILKYGKKSDAELLP